MLLALLMSVLVGLLDERPNVLLILCDDLGYGDVGCFGNDTIRTPRLDRLASEGARLTSCYAPAPVCSPSRAGFLTGRTPYRSGVYDWIPAGHSMHLPRDEVTVASLLRSAGYATGHFGKWHLNGHFNDPRHPQPSDHGFDHWFSTQNNAAPSHRNPRNFVRNGEAVGETSGFSCQIVADEAIEWMTGRAAEERPFFAFICFHEPHEPVDSPAALVETYPEATKRGEALYRANVTNMDDAVGRLLDALEAIGEADQTLVWFTSDNGPETLDRYAGAWRSHGSPGPLRGMKLSLYEGGIRVPGIVRWPGRTAPESVIDEPISGVDLLPTLCEIAGVEPGERFLDGTSVVAALDGGRVEREVPLHWHYDNAIGAPKTAMRVADWVYVAPTSAGRVGRIDARAVDAIHAATLTPGELYDLRFDLAQEVDRVRLEPDQASSMRVLLERLREEVVASAPAADD